MRFRHVALMISDLRAAEYYYRAIFGMSVLFREAAMEPGGPHAETWATLPSGPRLNATAMPLDASPVARMVT